ncbi:MAG: hypothetical protein JO016_20610 [Actinobacteria bacterium]|nr:hypothetical protein [Actinomycetota bacterium]
MAASENAGPARRARSGPRPGTWRYEFRGWRRTRPFWGGLLLVVAGLEMLLIPLTGVLARGQIKLVIYVGIGGVFGILIGALLIACGLALWFTPAYKTFYAIAGVLLSLLSFIGTNLGGFFIGMLLGIVGGSLAFGWAPAAWAEPAPPPRPEPPQQDAPSPEHHEPSEPHQSRQPPEPPEPQQPPEPPDAGMEILDQPRTWGLGEPRPNGRGWQAGRSLAVATLLAVAIGALTGGPRASAAEIQPAHAQQAQQAQQAQSGQGCILFVICSPSPSPSPPATPSSSSSPSSGSGGGLGGLGGVLPTSGLPSTGPGLPVVGGIVGATPGAKNKDKNDKTGTGTQGLVVSSSPAVITASSATLNGLAYQGKVNMPVNGGGTLEMMKFTMNSQQLSALDLTVTGNGGTLSTAATSASFSGQVVLYATKLTGKLAGVPLTLTPDNAESTLLQLLNSLTPLVPVTLTDVTADQPVVLGHTGAITSLSITVS